MRHSTIRCVTLAVALLAAAGSVHARTPRRGITPDQRQQTLRRVKLIRSGIQLHRGLRQRGARIAMPRSSVLSDSTAAAKKYGDSWTCRESTRMLVSRLSRTRGCKLKLDSAGKNAFRWGNEGLVSFHYFGVDSIRRPTVLLDPTGPSNFKRDVQPGGMLRQLLDQAGARLGMQKAARRVTNRIARDPFGGLLVLANPQEIAVYKEALEQAGRRQAEMTRNAERAR